MVRFPLLSPVRTRMLVPRLRISVQCNLPGLVVLKSTCGPVAIIMQMIKGQARVSLCTGDPIGLISGCGPCTWLSALVGLEMIKASPADGVNPSALAINRSFL